MSCLYTNWSLTGDCAASKIAFGTLKAWYDKNMLGKPQITCSDLAEGAPMFFRSTEGDLIMHSYPFFQLTFGFPYLEAQRELCSLRKQKL